MLNGTPLSTIAWFNCTLYGSPAPSPLPSLLVTDMPSKTRTNSPLEPSAEPTTNEMVEKPLLSWKKGIWLLLVDESTAPDVGSLTLYCPAVLSSSLHRLMPLESPT